MQVNFSQYPWDQLTVADLKAALDLANVHPAGRSRMVKRQLIDLLVQTYNHQAPPQVTPRVAALLQGTHYPGPINVFQGAVPPTVSEGITRRRRGATPALPPALAPIPAPATPPPASPPQQPPPVPRRAPTRQRRPRTAAEAAAQAPAAAPSPSPSRFGEMERDVLIGREAAAQPSIPPGEEAPSQPPRPQSPPRIGRFGQGAAQTPPCRFVPTGPCQEGYSFIELAVDPATIPENRQIFLQVGNRTVCLDAQELEDYFNSAPAANRNILDTGYGACTYTIQQRNQIREIARRAGPAVPAEAPAVPGAQPALTLAPLPILRPVQPAGAAQAPVAPATQPRPSARAPSPARAPQLPDTLPVVNPVNVPASLQRAAGASAPAPAPAPAPAAARSARGPTSPRRSQSPQRRSRSPPRTAAVARAPTMRPEELGRLSQADLEDLIERARTELYRRSQAPGT